MTDIVSRQATTRALDAPVAHVRDQMQLQMDMANELASSDMLPKEFKGKPANVLIAVNMGVALGIEPVIALYGMHVIEGRPTLSAELQASLARSHGHRIRITEHTDEATTVVIVRHDDDHEFEVRYTLDDARRAGALDKVARRWPAQGRPQDWTFPDTLDPATATPDGMIAAGCPPVIANGDWTLRDSPWHKRPRLMLHHRALTEAITIACPEIRSGLGMDLGPIEPPVNTDARPVPADAVDIINANPEAGKSEEVEGAVDSVGEPPPPPEGSEQDNAGETPAAPAPDPDEDIVEAEIVEEDDQDETDERTVEEISGDPRDAVFDTPPATTMPKAAPEPETTWEPVDPATFKSKLMAETKWNSIRLLKELANVGESNITIDQVCEDERLYSIADAIIQSPPT